MPAQTVNGARGLLFISGVNGNKPVGIFNNISYSLNYDVTPIYVMGRYSPIETVPVAQEAVSITAQGFRVVNFGPHESAAVPRLQDLLNHEYIELAILDRQTGRRIAAFHKVRPTGYSTSVSARNVSEVTVNFIGIMLDDEGAEADQTKASSETPGAVTTFE